jgi:Holliday junction resolvasome RuvABC endonuclease subunit
MPIYIATLQKSAGPYIFAAKDDDTAMKLMPASTVLLMKETSEDGCIFNEAIYNASEVKNDNVG